MCMCACLRNFIALLVRSSIAQVSHVGSWENELPIIPGLQAGKVACWLRTLGVEVQHPKVAEVRNTALVDPSGIKFIRVRSILYLLQITGGKKEPCHKGCLDVQRNWMLVITSFGCGTRASAPPQSISSIAPLLTSPKRWNAGFIFQSHKKNERPILNWAEEGPPSRLAFSYFQLSIQLR